jgi:hypothetical protein
MLLFLFQTMFLRDWTQPLPSGKKRTLLGPIDGTDLYLQRDITYEVNVSLQRTICDETGNLVVVS